MVEKFRIDLLDFGANGAGQIIDSLERHCTICLSRPSRFWHIAMIVILIILSEKEF